MESGGTQEPAFQDDKIPTDLGSGLGSIQDPPLHGDPTYETWLKDNPPTDDMTDTPPLHGDPPPPVGRPQQELVDGTAAPDIAPDIEPLEPGEVVTVTPTPKDDVEDLYDQLDRVDPSTGLLIDPLLATGAEVEVTGEVVSEGIFSVDGTIILVNGEQVQVMNYGDAAALEDEATRISPGGSSFGPHIEGGPASMVTWAGAPHFFRTDTAIVLYVGESPTVIEALTKVMGPQFAGR